jgi:hypothetical protein
MARIFSNSPYSGASPSGQGSGDKNTPVVPPPPPTSVEVSVRTMKSDLEHMGRSLEEALRSIGTPGLASATGGAPPLPSILGGPKAEKSTDLVKFALWGTVVAVGVAVFFFIGYFFLPLALEKKAGEATPGAATSTPAGLPAAEPTSTTPAPVFLGHRSFLRSSPDRTLDLKFGNPVNPAYYNIFLNDLSAVLAGSGEAKLVEVVLKTNDGQAMAWTQMLEFLGISAVEKDFWLNRFEQDFTLFAYRQNDIWYPGYVLKLKPGQNPLVLQSAILKIESDPNLKNFFLIPPGDARGDFRDFQISGQPVRIRNFSQPGSDLVYGWLYNQYLVISASQAGFREVMLRL